MSVSVADPSGLGPPIKGPSALGSDPRRLWHLARTMAVSDFKLRFFGSALGYLWQLIRPLMLFGVLYAVFTQIVRLGSDVELYPVALLLGVVLFTFFSEATGGALSSLVDREALIRKVDFPRLAVPLSAVLTALMNVALNLIAVVVFLLLAGGERALDLARDAVPDRRARAVHDRPRDAPQRALRPLPRHQADLGGRAAGPLLRLADLLSDRHRRRPLRAAAKVMMLSPFAAIIQQSRHALIAPSHPSATAVAGWWILGTVAIFVVVIALGYRVFSNRAPNIAEQL